MPRKLIDENSFLYAEAQRKSLADDPDKLADFEDFYQAAIKIANETCVQINAAKCQIDARKMPYKAQYLLETVIAVLESRV